MYENGIGAINLPYRASAVGLDHSRSVHPLTLLMVSDIVSELLGKDFRVKNPFLFWTKAQMCKAMAEDGRNDLPPLTESCDSPHRKPNQPSQCGYCSSCLLRRQSLAAVGIEDKTKYIVFEEKQSNKERSLHFHNMLVQVRTFIRLLAVSDEPSYQWEALTHEFPVLDDIVDQISTTENLSPANLQGQLLQLYQTYVAEWEAVEALVGRLEEMDLLPSGTWERLRDRGLKVREVQKELNLETIPKRTDMTPIHYQHLAIEALDQGLITEGRFADYPKVDRLEARRIAETLREHSSGLMEEVTNLDLRQV